MDIPLLTWSCIALAVALVLAIRVREDLCHGKNDGHKRMKRHRLLQSGHVWEEFYVPGDRVIKDGDDYDDSDDY